MKSVIVIGAGFAGLSAALESARRGSRVHVLEALEEAGGRARRFTTPLGFSFDAGPTLIVMTGPLRSALGDATFQALGLERLEPGYRVMWPGGERFDMHSNLAKLLEEVARFEGFHERAASVEYLARVHEQYLDARANILEVDHTALSFARTLLQPGKFGAWSLGNLPRFARRYFKHRRTLEAMTFQPLYLGTSPLKAPAIYALLAVEEIVGGVWYAPGGTGAVVRALLRECERHGVTFEYGTRVRAVRRSAARIDVDAEGRTYTADGLIVCTDREPALQTLFPHTRAPRRPVRYGHSAMVWYAGVRGGLPLGHHSVFLPDDPWKAYAQLDRGELPSEPMVYACNATASEPGVAPPDHSALMLLAPVPNAGALPAFDERAFFDRACEQVERAVGPLQNRIVELRSFGPREFASQLGLARGAAFGPDHTLDQMGPMRPPIRHPQHANVVFAGSGTHPGSGVPMVLISGRLAAQRLHEVLA